MNKETVASMEPMLPAQGQRVLEDLAMKLAKKGSALAGALHPVVRQSMGDLVRSMNCYYSNLIEGHDTHPRDIDKALAGDFSGQQKERNLQLEAKAHIEVQRMIDRGEAPMVFPAKAFLLWVHREFCSRLPQELLRVENPGTHEIQEVIPGEWRTTEVSVGRHVPPLAENIEYFLKRFEEVYSPDNLSQVQQVIAIAASHHRLVWIHPFLDGNGRVARLYSHALLLHSEVGSNLWSISRGLARKVETYKSTLMAADAARKGDLDGRGSLSHEELVNFCRYFLATCIDQVEFVTKLLDTDQLLTRMEIHVREEIAGKRLPKGAFSLLREAFYSGEFTRGKATEITGYRERQARDVLSKLLEKGYLTSATERGPVRLGFPPEAIERWLPGLYPT